MNTQKIKELTDSLESIKSAKFYNPNWAFIGLKTGFIMCTRSEVIRTSPLNDLHSEMTKELNDAITPVVEKYAKIFEKAIKNEILK